MPRTTTVGLRWGSVASSLMIMRTNLPTSGRLRVDDRDVPYRREAKLHDGTAHHDLRAQKARRPTLLRFDATGYAEIGAFDLRPARGTADGAGAGSYRGDGAGSYRKAATASTSTS